MNIRGFENTVQSLTLRNTEGIVAGGFPDDPGETPLGIVITGNRVEDTRGDGIVVGGFRNIVKRNVVVASGGDGIIINGGSRFEDSDTMVNNNLVSFSGGHGLRFGGRGHTVFRNVARTNAGDGLFVEATRSSFDRNQSYGNDGFGIEDPTVGEGTAGTANTYTLNVCSTANALGKSSPAGLCR